MAITNEVMINKLVEQVSSQLKNIKEITPPEWAEYVKTGTHKQRPPIDDDWWYKRSAAILLKIRKLGPIGVLKLKTAYGGKKNRGVRPEKFVKGSGNIIRKVLQQLDAAGFTKKVEKELNKGRIITPKGISFLDKTAIAVKKAK